MGVARISQRGGHTVSNRGYSHFCNLNIVGCLHKKRLTKGGHGHPRTPLATPLQVPAYSFDKAEGFVGLRNNFFKACP